MSTWEQRMAQRAAERKAARERQEVDEARRQQEADGVAMAPRVSDAVARCAAGITDDDLDAWMDPDRPAIGCACVGPPPELRGYVGAPCYCVLHEMAYEKRLADRRP